MDPIEAKLNRYGVNSSKVARATESSFIDFMASTVNAVESDDSELSRFSRPLLTFAAVATIIIMLAGIFGNLLTIIALAKCPKVRNVAADFIISLCVSDCLFCLVVLPFMSLRFIQGTWTHGEFLCTLIPFIQYGNVGVSLLCIAMITINRYIMIAHHSIYARIYKKFWIYAMIIFCWLFSYGFQLPTLFRIWGEFGYDKRLGTCSILEKNGRSSKAALFVIAFVIPCIIIIICYARIFWVVHESEQRLRQHSTVQNSIPNNQRSQPMASTASQMPQKSSMSSYNVNNNITSAGDVSDGVIQSGNKLQQTKSTRIKDTRDVKQRRNEWRITKMVLAIFLSFLCCYFPITIAKIIDKNVNYPWLHIIGYIMIYLSACINPIIYVIMNKQYRQAYKTVLMCKTPRMLSFTHGIGSSVGEKWKNIGVSYNHSRTQVSQVSIADNNNETDFSYRSSQTRQDSPHPRHLPVIPDSKEPGDV